MDCIDYTDGYCDWKDMDCVEYCGEDPGECDGYIPLDEDIEPVNKDLFS